MNFNNIISLIKFYFIFNINLKSKYKVYNYLENPIYIIQLKLNYLVNIIFKFILKLNINYLIFFII